MMLFDCKALLLIINVLLLSQNAVNSQRMEECGVDIAFLLDGSASLGIGYWNLAKFVVEEFSNTIPITSRGVHMGVLVFNDQSTITIPLDRYTDSESFKNHVERLKTLGGVTDITSALRMTREQFFEPRGGIKSGGRSIVVVIGDGQGTMNKNQMYPEADQLKAEGAVIYVLGLGSKVDEQDLKYIANDPDERYFFRFRRYRTMIIHVNERVYGLCEEEPKTTHAPTTRTTVVTTQATTRTERPATQSTTRTERPTTQATTRTEHPTTQAASTSKPTTTEKPLQTTPKPTTVKPTTSEPGEIRCQNLDIAFLLDNSGSINGRNFENIKRHVIDFIDRINIGPDDNQVGVVTFSTNAVFQIELNKYHNKRQLQRAILDLQWMDQMTNISGAIRTTYRHLYKRYNGERKDSPNVAIIFTDGQSNRETHLTAKEAARMRYLGTDIFVVSIGNETNQYELTTVSSRPQYYYLNQYFSSASYEADAQNVFNKICAAQRPVQLVPNTKPDSCQTDILLLLDDSNVNALEWDSIILAMQNFVRNLVIGEDSQLLSVMTIGGGVRFHFNLTDYIDSESLIAAIGRIQPRRGASDLPMGVLNSRKMFPVPTDKDAVGQWGSTGDRIWVKNHVIIISNQINFLYIQRLRYSIYYVGRQGIEVYVVLVDPFGFGSHDNPDNMDPSDIIAIPGFSILVDNTQILAKAVCNENQVIWSCDFEDRRSPLCNMIQSRNDQFEWTLTSRTTDSLQTGPSGAADGRFFLYIEASEPRVEHDTAELSFRPGRRGEHCFMFKYHMWGEHMGSLIISQRTQGETNIGSIHWALHGEQQPQWNQGAVTLNLTDSDQIVIRGVRATAHTGDIAIDSLQLTLGVCPPQYTGKWFIIEEDEDFTR